jgi:selenide,water dikinase
MVAEKVRIQSSLSEQKIASLFDPQTSGGLLFGVSHEKTERVIRFLKDEGFGDTSVIGEVTGGEPGSNALKID